MTNSLVETLIGAIVVAVAAVFLFFAYSTSGMTAHGGGYDLFALFSRVDGLALGADVKIAGIKVGTVTNMALDTQRYQAKVVMNIGPTYQVPDDSQVRVASEGLLGGSYLAILPGGSDTNLKPGGQIEYTQGTLDIFSLISQAITSMAGNKAAGAGQSTPDAPSNQPATTAPH